MYELTTADIVELTAFFDATREAEIDALFEAAEEEELQRREAADYADLLADAAFLDNLF